MIELHKITSENFDAVLKLNVTDEQKDLVDSSIYCLASAYVDVTTREKPPMIFAIHHEKEVIGLVEIGFYQLSDDSFLTENFGDKSTYEINTFLIDQHHQGKGLGKLALKKIIEYIRTFPQGAADAISVSYWQINEAAKGVYVSVGFEETGEKWDGETFDAWDESRTDVEFVEVGARLGLKDLKI